MSAGDIISEKIVREEIFDCVGTIPLTIGDPQYLEDIANGTDTGHEKDYVFDGRILGSSTCRMRIRQVHTVVEGINANRPIELDSIEVRVVQGSRMTGDPEDMLQTYMNGEYYEGKLKKEIEFGCDTASFVIETMHGNDLFHTGADGYYGSLACFKQCWGMILDLELDGQMFSFDEIRTRMGKLFHKLDY